MRRALVLAAVPAIVLAAGSGCSPTATTDKTSRSADPLNGKGDAVATSATAVRSVGPRDAKDDSAEVFDAAIRAHGIDAALPKIKAGRVKAVVRSTVTADHQDEATWVVAFQLPAQLRRQVTFKTPSGTTRSLYVRNGNRAWNRSEDGVVAQAKRLLRPEDIFPLALLFGLSEYRQAGLAYSQIPADQPLDDGQTGVRMHLKGRWFGDLILGRADMLVVEHRRPDVDPRTGKYATATRQFTDYRNVGSAMFPMRLSTSLNGKGFMEHSVLEFEVLDAVSGSEFAEPKPGE